jgi:hypothetical protein
MEQSMSNWIKYVTYNDGGRRDAGFKYPAEGDCVVRALSILSERGYMAVYNAMIKLIARERGGARSVVDNGIYAKTYTKFLNEIGASKFKRVKQWQDIPREGKYFVITASHAVAYVNGVIHDVFDPVGDEELEGYYQI